MSERSENPFDEQATQGGWHDPRQASPWQEAEQPTKSASWRTISALPDELETEPQERGIWHLPDDGDTSFDFDDKIEVSDAPRVMTTSSTPTVQRPEDIIAQIVGQKSPTRPEDMIPSRRKETAEEETSASDAFDAGETLLVDEESHTVAAIDQDDESFQVSELFALASLAQGDDDPSLVDTSDLSPAERVLLNRVQEYEDELPQPQQQQGTPIDMGITQTLDDTSQQSESSADYARRMAEQFDSDADESTQTYQATQAQAPQATQAPQVQYTAEEIELAQKFKETFRQVQVLRQMAQQNQIDRAELETRLQQHTVLDSQGVWWMIGYETNEWYRYNNTTQGWEAAPLPVPIEAASPRTETGVGHTAPDILEQSLPYLPEDQSQQPIEYSSGDYDANQYTQASEQFTNQYGVQDPPIPNPDQPVIDPGQTMVGAAWDRTTQTYAEPTVQGMPQVDDYGQTMASPSTQDYGQQAGQAGAYQDQYGQQQDQYGGEQEVPTGYEDYDAQASSPTYDVMVDGGRKNLLTVLGIGAVLFAIFAVIVLISGVLFIQFRYNEIVEPYRAAIIALDEQNFAFQTATILAADGTTLAEIESEEGARIPVSIEDGQVSPFFIHAVVSSEDPTFYENPGISFGAILRAFYQNYTSGEVVSGASTITQQIARERVIGSRAEGLNDKLTEALVALEVSEIYTKTDILNIYINEFPFGQRTFGIESASLLYFDKSASELNPVESAMLAGILPAPSTANPITSRTQAFSNMDVVLDRMIETNCLQFEHTVDTAIWRQSGQPFCVNENTIIRISEDSETSLFTRNGDGSLGGYIVVMFGAVEAADYTIDTTNRSHFVDYVLGQVDIVYGRGAYIERGFTIQTTLLPGLQREAEAALRDGVNALSLSGARTGAVIVLDPHDGSIRAMVGSPDYLNADIEGQNNLTLLPQQPGSAIKPIVYAATMEGSLNGFYSPAHIVWDVDTDFNINNTIYTPTNFDGKYHGPITVRYALAQSLNIPAVRSYAFLGVDASGYSARFVEVANAMGIDFDYSDIVEFDPIIGLPTAIGSTEVSLMDLTHAYATIANDGQRVELYSITSITERGSSGREQQVELIAPLVNPEAIEPVRAISPQTAYLLQDILSDDAARTATINGIPSSFPSNSFISGNSLNLPLGIDYNRAYIAAKTGTNNVQTSAGVGNPSRIWTLGFTNNWVVGVWIGTLEGNQAMGGGQRITGLTNAAPVWNRVMRTALGGINPGAFERPTGIREDVVCLLTGALSPNTVDNCPANYRVTELYAESVPPLASDQGFVKWVEVNSWTRESWSASCGDEQNRVAIPVANIDDPYVLSYLNSSGQTILAQLGLPTPLESAPTQPCQPGTVLPTVRIALPTGNTVVENTLTISGQISAQNMSHWQLSVSPRDANNFTVFTAEARTDTVPNANSPLGEWNSRDVANGFYTLRLEVYANDGGFIYHHVDIVVDNGVLPPTAIPSPTIAPVVITPIPFPSPTPLGG